MSFILSELIAFHPLKLRVLGHVPESPEVLRSLLEGTKTDITQKHKSLLLHSFYLTIYIMSTKVIRRPFLKDYHGQGFDSAKLNMYRIFDIHLDLIMFVTNLLGRIVVVAED